VDAAVPVDAAAPPIDAKRRDGDRDRDRDRDDRRKKVDAGATGVVTPPPPPRVDAGSAHPWD
jgi:hypothetical protein